MGLFRRHPSIKLNVLIYKEDNEWIAHCLQMDLVATNIKEKAVEEDIINLIKAQVIYAFKNDNLENLFKPAPSEEWEKMKSFKKCDSRKIKLDLSEDKETVKRYPPIKEVELCFA